MNVEQARFNMIEQQIRPWGVLDAHVLDLLAAVRREDFVPPQHRALAFADLQIPLKDSEAAVAAGQVMLEPRIEAAFMRHDLVRWEFDMLATLRRAGEPFMLSPTQLFSTLMITSGTMTHRLKALEKRGFIRRLPNPDDARSMLVALTPEGRELIDKAVESHVENERQLLSGLSAAQRHQLDEALTIFMRLLEKE